MSYFTNVTIIFDVDPPDFDTVLDRARTCLESQGETYSDVDFVLDQLRNCLKRGDFDFKGVYSEDFDRLMTYVTKEIVTVHAPPGRIDGLLVRF